MQFVRSSTRRSTAHYLSLYAWVGLCAWTGLFGGTGVCAEEGLSAGMAVAEESAVEEPAKVWKAVSQKGLYQVSLSPKDGQLPIGKFHPWTLEVRNAAGQPVDDLTIVVGGGMEAHGHGLPTQPKITQKLGNGRYLIEGLKLTMVGRWTLTFRLDREGHIDAARLFVDVDY